jgi:hypothetical protein
MCSRKPARLFVSRLKSNSSCVRAVESVGAVVITTPRPRGTGDAKMRGRRFRAVTNNVFDGSPDVSRGISRRHMVGRGVATLAISASSMPASFGTHYTQARVSGSGEDSCIRFAATKRTQETKAEEARCRLASCRDTEREGTYHMGLRLAVVALR